MQMRRLEGPRLCRCGRPEAGGGQRARLIDASDRELERRHPGRWDGCRPLQQDWSECDCRAAG